MEHKKRLNSSELQHIGKAFEILHDMGAIDRARDLVNSAGRWDQILAHYCGILTGIDCGASTIRHLRVEAGIRWFDAPKSENPGNREALFPDAKNAPTLFIVSSEDFGRMVDEAVRQALNIERDPDLDIPGKEESRELAEVGMIS